MFNITKDSRLFLESVFDTEDMKKYEMMNEEEQGNVNVDLFTKLYTDAITKYEYIDFGDIPDSMGDITKLEKYDYLIAVINKIEEISDRTSQKFEELDPIKMAIENVKTQKFHFEKGFKLNIEFIQMVYNCVVLNIYSAISYLLSVSLEFIKNPEFETLSVTLKKKTSKNSKLTINSIEQYNKSKRDLDNLFDILLSNRGQKEFTGLASYGLIKAMIMAGVVFSIIPFIRELIYQFYFIRIKTEDYVSMQVDYLEANLDNISRTDLDSKKKKRVKRNQEKVISKLKSLANIIELKTKRGKQDAEKEYRKKMKVEDIKQDINNNINNTNNSVNIL